MEDSKYYTPTIDEFCDGFEYYFCSAYQEGVDINEIIIDGEDGYKKCIYKLPNNSKWPTRDHILGGIGCNQYRVKYLDKEDIENIGFMQGKLPYQFYKEDCDLWIFIPGTSNNFEILGEDEICIASRRYDEVVFRGTIKSKSELIKVLKMLGVNGN